MSLDLFDDEGNACLEREEKDDRGSEADVDELVPSMLEHGYVPGMSGVPIAIPNEKKGREHHFLLTNGHRVQSIYKAFKKKTPKPPNDSGYYSSRIAARYSPSSQGACLHQTLDQRVCQPVPPINCLPSTNYSLPVKRDCEFCLRG